jgi:hypothetical protein
MKQLPLLILLMIPSLFYGQSPDSAIVDYFDKKWNEASQDDYHIMRTIKINKAIALNDEVLLYPYTMVDSKDRIRYEGFVKDLDSPNYTFFNKSYDKKGRIDLIEILEYQQYLSLWPDTLFSHYSLIESCLKDTFIHYSDDFALQIKLNKDGTVKHIAAVNKDCCCEMTVLRFGRSDNTILLEDKIDGQIQGRKFRYNDSGLILDKRYMLDGKREGRWEEYTTKGQLVRVRSYKHGIKHGLWERYREDGSRRYQKNYKMGVLHGPYKEYHFNGQVSSEGSYKNGLQDGKWRYYDKKGNEIYYRLFDANRG